MNSKLLIVKNVKNVKLLPLLGKGQSRMEEKG